MRGGNPRMGAVNVQGTDDHCCGVFFLKWVLHIYNVILLVHSRSFAIDALLEQ